MIALSWSPLGLKSTHGVQGSGFSVFFRVLPIPRLFNLFIELGSPRASAEPSSASQASGIFQAFPRDNLGGSSLCKDQGVENFQGGLRTWIRSVLEAHG